MHMYMFQSFARLIDLQRLKNVKVDPMSVKVGYPCCRQYFLQEVVVRFYFLVKITQGKVSVDFTGDKGYHIVLQHSAFVIKPHVIQDKTNLSM